MDYKIGLQHLRYFYVLAETQHMTKAAEKLHITQPALSKTIHVMEMNLGVKLFERTNKGIRLTKHGQFLNEHTRTDIENIEMVFDMLHSMGTSRKCEITIATSSITSITILPEVLKSVRESNLKYPIMFRQVASDTVCQDVLDDKADLGLSDADDLLENSELGHARLYSDRMYAFVPDGHRLAERKSIAIDELTGEPVVTYSPEHGNRPQNLMRQTMIRHNYEGCLNLVGKVADEATMLAMVRTGGFVACAPDVPNFTYDGVVRLELNPCLFARHFLVWKKNSHLPPAIEVIKARIIEASFSHNLENNLQN